MLILFTINLVKIGLVDWHVYHKLHSFLDRGSTIKGDEEPKLCLDMTRKSLDDKGELGTCVCMIIMMDESAIILWQADDGSTIERGLGR